MLQPLLSRQEGGGEVYGIHKRLFQDLKVHDLWYPVAVRVLGDYLSEKPADRAQEAARALAFMGVWEGPVNRTWLLDRLARQLKGRPQQAAVWAAHGLATIAGRRPQVPSWDGRSVVGLGDAGDVEDRRSFWDYWLLREYSHGSDLADEDIRRTVEALVTEMSRATSRDPNGYVVDAVIRAIGWIGYGRPELVEGTVPALLERLRKRAGRPAPLLWALSNIGFSRPDLLPAEIRAIFGAKKPPARDPACELAWPVWHLKIGRSPSAILTALGAGEIQPEEALEKLSTFLVGMHLSGSEEVRDAALDILDRHPREAAAWLSTELEDLRDHDHPAPYYAASVLSLVQDLAEHRPKSIAALAPVLWSLLTVADRDHYWYDFTAAILLELKTPPVKVNVAREGVRVLLEGEGRASVVGSLKRLRAELLG